MSNISLTLEGASRAEERKVVIDDALVEEMCAHLLAEKLREMGRVAPEHRALLLPQVHINEGGFRRLAVTCDDFERLLRPWKVELGRLMLKYPRHDGATIAGYLSFLTRSGDNWDGRFHRMKVWLAHIHRIECEEAAERKHQAQIEAQRKRDEEERRRQERLALERDASPSDAEIKRLLAVIAEAREAEELMALIDNANAARYALRNIFEKEREACEALGRPVPERSHG
jgi:hypothetical protein